MSQAVGKEAKRTSPLNPTVIPSNIQDNQGTAGLKPSARSPSHQQDQLLNFQA
jgi:hypothetical protein